MYEGSQSKEQMAVTDSQDLVTCSPEPLNRDKFIAIGVGQESALLSSDIALFQADDTEGEEVFN